MKEKFLALVKNPMTYVVLAVGMVLGGAYLVKSAMARKVLSKLPGSAQSGA